MYITSVTQKGQATIPGEIRKRLGLKAGQKVVFLEKDGEVIVRPVLDFLSLKGSIKSRKIYNEEKIKRTVGQYLAKRHHVKTR